MKKQIMTILMLFSLMCSAQTPDWSWTQSSGGGDHGDWAYATHVDNQGNIYVAGSFKSESMTFGSIILTNTLVGFNDMFLVKYNSQKDVLWAIGMGGTNSDGISTMDVDAEGNIYIGGYFNSATIDFGGGLTVSNSNTNMSNMLVAKFSSSGIAVWAKTAIGDDGIEQVMDICVDPTGNVYAVGFFESTSCSFGNFILMNTGTEDGFLAKYDNSGNVLQAYGYGSESSFPFRFDECTGVGSDNDGNIYMTGFYRSDVTFGDTTLLNSSGDAMAFIVKYNDNLEKVWVKNTVGSWQVGKGIAVDNNGTLFISGFFSGSSMQLGGFSATGNGQNDFFLAKLNSNGAVEWLNVVGSNEYEQGAALNIDSDGNILAGIYFSSPSITIGNAIITNNGAGDILLVKYLSSGEIEWALHAGGEYDENINSISSSVNGSIIVCGGYSSPTVSFGNTMLTNTGGNNGQWDLFIAETIDVSVSVGIDKIIEYPNILVYPNPVSDFITIKSNSKLAGKEFQIVNSVGKMVHNGSLVDGDNICDLSKLSAGYYYLVVPQELGERTKIVKF